MDRYFKTYTVRWADCDVNGHMRNTAYSEYGTDTRVSFLTERGFGFDRMLANRIGPVILHEAIDYMREVRLGDVIEVDLVVVGLSPDGARFKFEHDVWLPGHKKAARIVLAGGWMDLDRRKLRVPPDELLRVMDGAPRGEPFEEMKPMPPGRGPHGP
ncbi:MAG TPA: acyl-CoA thioesterase [Anaeromyxobacter sp.]|nr:acyl-CoA thioesterase [Anaeromyxobacter sp.]